MAALVALLAAPNAGCGEASPSEARIIGQTGVGPREFNYPRGIAIDARRGQMWVVDKGGRIQCLSAAGEFVRGWRVPEIDAGRPIGLGVAPDGRVFVADTHYSRVMIFSPEGELLARFGENGFGPGQFLLPTDVAIDENGFVYVAEYGGNDRISKFSPRLEHQLSFGGPGAGEAALRRPQRIALDDGGLWVADSCNHRLVHFDRDGRFLGAFGSLGDGRGALRFPYGVGVLSDRTLVVCEYGNNRVQRFSRDGASLGAWGGPGRRAGELAYPWAVDVDANDQVVVVDSGNNRLQVFAGLDRRTWH
ncbi:MAG TPA: 6-bladed beta-propeller [Phycisphaerae bacterium]|nr:6-bladed beta-propeller [Phycisphaerae bacterium]